jgi:excinuclease ABC subunit C
MTNKKTELYSTVKEFPTLSGVYVMKDSSDKVIYIGKAKDLKSRVKSYFSESKDLSPKTKFLVQQIQKIDYIITHSEVEAFLLEASLIKKHRPKYNIRLKDDKSYPYIQVSIKDPYPRFYIQRKYKRDGSLYFGPFTSGLAVHKTIETLSNIFQIRDCSDHFGALTAW